jgi:RHS repeat-associated protein
LVYNTESVNVLPVINVTVQTDPVTPKPTSIQAQLTWDGTPEGWVTFSTAGHNAGDTYLLGLQVPASAPVTNTDLHSWMVEVKLLSNGGTPFDPYVTGTVPIVVRTNSSFGPGWSLSSLDQLFVVTGGVVRAYGNGQARFYQDTGNGTFQSPDDDFGTLSYSGGTNGTYTYTAVDQTKWTFDYLGRQVRLQAPDGLGPTYVYDAVSTYTLVKVLEPDGGVTTFNYTGGLLSSVNEPGGRTVTVGHSGAGDVTAVTEADGGLWTFAYDSVHRLTGHQVGPFVGTYSYSPLSGVIGTMQLASGSSLNVLSEAEYGLQTSPARSAPAYAVVTYGLGQKTSLTSDYFGSLLARANPDGGTELWVRDKHSLAQTYTDPISRTTSYAYDATSGDLTQVTNPDGTLTTVLYDQHWHKPAVTIDELGNRTTMSYDATTGDLLTVKNALNQTTSYTWSNGLLQTVTDPLGHVTTSIYDPSGNRRLLATVNVLNQRTSYAYDAAGSQTTITDPLLHVTSMTYDGLRRELTRTAADGGVTTTAYDALGDVTSVTDPLGHVTSYVFDARGLQISVTEAVGTPVQRTTTTAYDNVMRPTAVTDANNHVTSYGYDAVGRLKTTTSPVGGVETTVYDLAGQVTSRQDALGNTTSYAYDQRGRTTKTIEGYSSNVARTGTMLYDAAGNVLSQTTGIASTNPQVVTTSYGYDALNRQTQVIDAFGTSVQRTATMLYDAAGNLLSQTTGIASSNQQKVTTSYGYDALNRQTQVIDAYGTSVARTATMIFDAAGNLLSQTTGQSTTLSYAKVLTTSYAYDAVNRQTQTIEAFGTSLQRSSSTAYDLAGNVLSRTDALGHVTSYAYDALNQQTKVIDAYGTSVARTATMLYDAVGNVLSETTGQSTTLSYAHVLTTSYAYDAADRKTQVIDAYGTSVARTATMLYDLNSNLLSETTGQSTTATYAHALTTSYAYDALNRQTAVIEAYGVSGLQRTSTKVYDAANNVLRRIDAANNTTSYSYDALNRQITVQTPAGGTATTTYDSAGNVLTQTDQLGHTTSYAYDALNRRTTVTDPRGGVTSYTYDAEGNQLTLIDPVTNVTTMAYDVLGRLTQQTDPLNHNATFAYSVMDRLTSTTDRNGRIRNLSYDALDRQTGETWVTGSTTVNTCTYTYDAADNQLTAADQNGTYTLSYDALNRLTAEQELFGQVLTFAYDAADNRNLVQDSQNGVTTSVYDSLNRLTSRQFGGSGQTPLRIDPSWTSRDQLLSLTRYSDLAGNTLVGTSTYGYDGAMRLTSLTHKYANGNVLASYVYAYDQASRLMSETDNGTQTTYGYDNANELTQVNGTSLYGYDLNGNRNTTGYQTGGANQLTNDGTFTYTYDNEGNLTKKSKGPGLETWYYGYDHLNHLTSVAKTTDGTTTVTLVTFAYDVFNDRIEEDAWTQQVGVTTITRFAYDGQNVWADLDGNHSNSLLMRRQYLDGVDQPYARINAGGTAAWYDPDHLGSVRDVVNLAGTMVLDHVDYDGFGKITNETQPSNGDREKYTGREWEGLIGLQYNRARYYDPATGRWTSQDPIGFAAGDNNLYRYAGNDPTNSVDSTGLIPWVVQAQNPNKEFRSRIEFKITHTAADGFGGALIKGLEKVAGIPSSIIINNSLLIIPYVCYDITFKIQIKEVQWKSKDVTYVPVKKGKEGDKAAEDAKRQWIPKDEKVGIGWRYKLWLEGLGIEGTAISTCDGCRAEIPIQVGPKLVTRFVPFPFPYPPDFSKVTCWVLTPVTFEWSIKGKIGYCPPRKGKEVQ